MPIAQLFVILHALIFVLFLFRLVSGVGCDFCGIFCTKTNCVFNITLDIFCAWLSKISIKLLSLCVSKAGPATICRKVRSFGGFNST